jgi:adenine deaminase
MKKSSTRRRDLIDVILKKKPAGKIIYNGKLVNVYSGEIYECAVAIFGDRIAAVDGFEVDEMKGPDTVCIDAKGMYLVPGLVEPHLHSYHSYMSIPNYAEAMLIHGTTSVADGFYGQGVVGGIDAIKLAIKEFEQTPLKLIFSIPVIAYLQNRELGIEPAPNSITEQQLFEMLEWPETDGLEEPPYLPIVEQNEVFLKLFERAIAKRIPITGHAAGISVAHLNAYAAAGVISDHEQTTARGAVEAVRRGVKMLMRQGSGAPNVKELTKAITEKKVDPRAFSFCADLASPEKLFHEGDIDECIRVAVRAGIPPIVAIQMATLSAAEVYNLQGEIGSIAPGKIADILFVKDLRDFTIAKVMADGDIVVEDGLYLPTVAKNKYPPFMYNTVILKQPITSASFDVYANSAKVEARVIRAVDASLFTDEAFAELPVVDGVVQPDVANDILRIAMVDRHGKTGNIGNGFISGFRLKKGAVASSVNAVCENIVVVGANNHDMAIAANHLAVIGGGKVVVVDGEIVAQIELPLLGLLSEDPLRIVVQKFEKAYLELKKLGCTLTSPFATLEFSCACGEIGKLKIFDGGYIDAEKIEKVDVLRAYADVDG